MDTKQTKIMGGLLYDRTKSKLLATTSSSSCWDFGPTVITLYYYQAPNGNFFEVTEKTRAAGDVYTHFSRRSKEEMRDDLEQLPQDYLLIPYEEIFLA